MAITSRNEIRSIIENRVALELANAPAIPVVFHNMDYEPAVNASWVQCLVSFGQNEYLSQGLTTDSQNRVVGLLLLNIFTPQGEGPGANYVIAKRVRDLYNRVIVSGVYFDAANGPSVLATPVPEGYFQTQVRVTFEFIEEL